MATKSKRRLWIFDIDGTLTGPQGRGMQAAVVTGLFMAMRSGSLVGVNSGRDLRSCRTFHQMLDMNGPVIAEDGCGWWQPQMGELSRGLCLHRLSDECRQEIREAIVGSDLSERVWEDWRKEYVSSWYSHAFNTDKPADPELVYRTIVGVTSTKDQVAVNQIGESVTVAPKGTDKGSGLLEVCGELQVPLETVGYVGDSMNDWPALAQVLVAGGRGVIMGKDEALRRQVGQMGGEILEDGSIGLVKWLAEEFGD